MCNLKHYSMKTSFRICLIFILLTSSALILTSCKKKPGLPAVTTANVSGISQTTASSGGNVSDDGGAEVSSRGVCWSTAENPTTSGSRTSDGTGVGSFTSSLSLLTPGTKYYLRAYATNSEGTSYGTQVSFTTGAILTATVQTTSVSSITGTTAVSGGTITSDGGGSVTAKGVCWALTTNPTTSNNKTSDGSGSGNFTSNITGLTPATTYYVRGYAINSAGTAYGNEVSFTTAYALPKCTTSQIQSIAATTAISGGSISDDGGKEITAYGICWSKNSNPTIADSHTLDGSGRASYQSIISGLDIISGIVYHVRAYATNSVGTGYGNDISFTTIGIIPKTFNQSLTYGSVTDVDGNIYKTIQIGTQVWMAENLETTKLNDGSQITLISDQQSWSGIYSTHESAYCWYDDRIVNKDIYGAFYTWNAVETGKLCPSGWHVPSLPEWTALATSSEVLMLLVVS
jgi:hypothetical protein